MATSPVLQQLIDLARSATGATCAELVLLGEPEFRLTAGSGEIGSHKDWTLRPQESIEGNLDEPGQIRGCLEWVSSFISVPITGPSAEEGWLAVASADPHAFTSPSFESTRSIGELIENHLDQNTERSRITQLAEALRSNQAELQATRDQLAATNADLEQFAYIAAHELVAPLRSVSIYSEFLESLSLENTSPSALETLQCTEAIRSGISAMHKQVQYLLEFSRAQGIASDLGAIDLRMVVSSALDTLAESIEQANAIVNIGDLPHVQGREVPLQSVFANLIGNAVNYRHPDRQLEIDIRSELGDGACRITVQDNGRGIDDEDQARVFQLFERATTEAPGTGIGLALSRRIIEAHGGEIGVERGSESGSLFWIELPAV